MSDNPMADAVKPVRSPTTEVVGYPSFYQSQIDQDRLKKKARNMTRQQMFDNGFITVADLDDEELRYGKCRDANGRIPRNSSKTEMVPRDLYDEMVIEHEKRFDEKLRQQLDAALETVVEIMSDKTVEPADRHKAAVFLFERVKGKTPERVQVSASKEDWEDVFSGVAKMTRAQSHAQRNAIDAEVVDVPLMPQGHASAMEESGLDGEAPTREQTTGVDDVQVRRAHTVHGSEEGPPQRYGEPMGNRPEAQPEFYTGPTAFDAPIPVPDHLAPANSNPVVEANTRNKSDEIREALAAKAELAERRKAAKKRIQDAKKRRIIQRATGVDAVSVDISDTQSKFDAATREDATGAEGGG